MFGFFFSSRRRHTRWNCDWSSDVCSSDLATDPDGDVLTYSATGLPGGLSVSATTGVISGTLSYTSAGLHTVTATVSDGTLASSQTFAWTVTNVDRPPVLSAIADRTDLENATVSLPLVATDPD